MAAVPIIVRQIGISDEVLSGTSLSEVLYADAHLLETRIASERTAEQWARAFFEDVTDSMHEELTAAWSAIHFDLSPGAPGTVAGWRIASSTPERISLRADSAFEFQGELVTTVAADAVQLACYVAARDARARDAWFRVVPEHLAFVQKILEDTKDTLSR